MMINCRCKKEGFFFFLFFFSIFNLIYPYHTATAGIDVERKELRLFYKDDELVITPTRNPKPISRVAENITIITSEEIEAMNAHTLTDVLKNIPGVQVDIKGGPGIGGNVYIQASDYTRVTIMVDGVAMNNLSENFADNGAFPVQHIARIEIIKGPASSSWGSSLGGIINIITKSYDYSSDFAGKLSISYGEKNTTDHRSEVCGKMRNLGYYLYFGNLESDGMGPNTHFDDYSLYTKLNLDVTNKAYLFFTFGYSNGSRGFGEDTLWKILCNNDFNYLFSTLNLNYLINNKADIDFSFNTLRLKDVHLWEFNTGENFIKNFENNAYGGTIKLSCKYGTQDIVLGADYNNGKLESNIIKDGRQYLKKRAIFINDTILIDRFSVTPGIRYDYTSTSGDFLSPSLGITYKISKSTIFRNYVARGFNTPSLFETYGNAYFTSNPELEVEKILSIQTGIESTLANYFWIKTTLFRHNVWDAIERLSLPDESQTTINNKKQKRQGLEIEFSTAPIYNTTFSAGYVFIDAKDKNTGQKVTNLPRYTYDFGLKFNTNSFKSSLKGHYICWNNEYDTYNTFIWDINLIKQIYRNDHKRTEIFLSIHNIFNGVQYQWVEYKHPGRWIEGGVKCKF